MRQLPPQGFSPSGWPDFNQPPLDPQVRSGGVVALGESEEYRATFEELAHMVR